MINLLQYLSTTLSNNVMELVAIINLYKAYDK